MDFCVWEFSLYDSFGSHKKEAKNLAKTLLFWLWPCFGFDVCGMICGSSYQSSNRGRSDWKTLGWEWKAFSLDHSAVDGATGRSVAVKVSSIALGQQVGLARHVNDILGCITKVRAQRTYRNNRLRSNVVKYIMRSDRPAVREERFEHGYR
jgi:hypothetical protein